MMAAASGVSIIEECIVDGGRTGYVRYIRGYSCWTCLSAHQEMVGGQARKVGYAGYLVNAVTLILFTRSFSIESKCSSNGLVSGY